MASKFPGWILCTCKIPRRYPALHCCRHWRTISVALLLVTALAYPAFKFFSVEWTTIIDIEGLNNMTSNPAAVPQPIDDAQGDGRWMSMHNTFVKEASRMSSRCKVLFIGDSLVHQMKETETWDTLFQPLDSLNFGIGGDSTQHVFWRIQNGELENINPKVVVLLVGTNNVAHTPLQTAGNIVEGIEAIVWYINGINPQTKILVLALLPRGENPNPLRVKIMDINSQLENVVRSIPNATFLNADPGFVGLHEKISSDDMADFLHLTRSGYKKICKTIHKAILKLIKYS